MGASEDIPRTAHNAVVVELDADDVLFDLDNDATLRELDAAHSELDRRAKAVPRSQRFPTNNFVMVHDTDEPNADTASAWPDASQPTTERLASTARTEQLDAISALRRTVDIVHRNEVHTYAQTLRTAIEQRIAMLPDVGDVRVTVAAAATTSYIRSAPRPADTPARSDVNQAIADAIANTPTPGDLPGTLLHRVEAAHTEQLGAKLKNCAARR